MAWAQDFLNKGGGVSGSYAHPSINEAEAMNKSEIRKDQIGHASGSHGVDGGGKCYRYPIYIDNFSTYNQLYGSIGALLIFLLYIWMNSNILLLGFELNATLNKLNKQSKDNTTEI